MSEETHGSSDQTGAPPGQGDVGPRRHLKVVTDVFGRLWICPDDVDEDRDLAEQGGWRCGDTIIEKAYRTPPDPPPDRSTEP
jgi:hypothetical protein